MDLGELSLEKRTLSKFRIFVFKFTKIPNINN
jgi:hypothetical protein